MKKSPFLIFTLCVSILVSAAILFIQSKEFAGILKGVLWRKLPADLGIEGDFRDLEIKLLPPGLSINSPRVSVAERNVLGLPAGSTISADRIELNFRPLQMVSGNIRVNEVAIVHGDVLVRLDTRGSPTMAAAPPTKGSSKFKFDFRWDQLLKFKADSIALKDTHLRLQLINKDHEDLEFQVPSLRISQWIDAGNPGLQLEVNAAGFKGEGISRVPGLSALERFDGLLQVNAAGVRVQNLNLVSQGVEATASGLVKGNLKSTPVFGGNKDLSMDLNLESRGNIAAVLGLVEKPASKPAPKKDATPETVGSYTFFGKVTGSAFRALDTLKAEGILHVKDFKRGDLEAQSAEVEGKWQSSGGGRGELSVARAMLASPEREKSGGFQPGGGGKVSIGAFKVALPLSHAEAVSVPVKLERAHIHWLAGIALESVYGLDFRVSGPLDVRFSPASPERRAGWSLQSKIDLTVENFSLDNQRLHKSKPMKKLLGAPKILLKGDVSVDASGIRPDVLVDSGSFTKIRMGGKIDFKNGYDLKGTGTAALEDVGAIAGIPIRGKGPLAVAVHGPGSGVEIDFDADFKDAFYLNLLLGDLKGVITWHDGLDQLIFRKAQFTQGHTVYVADGNCDFSKEGSIALKVSAPEGNIEDFDTIFSNLVRDLWWFPRAINGPMKADVDITGGLDMDELKVAGHIVGANWRYFGETFDSVSLNGGYDRGRYYVTDLAGTKRSGRFKGYISYAKDGLFDWDFRTEDLHLTDFDLFSKLDVPMRGKITFDSTGKGRAVRAKEQSVLSRTKIGVSELNIRGKSYPPSELNVRSEGGVIQARGNALGGQGILSLDYDFYPGSPSFLSLDARQIDFSPIVLLINPSLMSDPSFSANATGNVDLKFFSGELERASGTMGIKSFMLAKTGSTFTLREPRALKIDTGTFDSTEVVLHGPTGDAGMRLSGRKGEIDGSIYGDLDLSIAEFLTSTVDKASGTMGLDVAVGGTVKNPTFLGRLALGSNAGSSVRIASLDSAFENLTGSILVRQNVLTVQNLEADLAGGRFTTDGSVTLFASKVPTLSLKADLGGNKIKVYPFQVAKVRGWVGVHGEDTPYVIDGDVKVESALIREKIFQQRNKGEGLKSALYVPPPVSNRPGSGVDGGTKFKLAINAQADQGVIVKNDLFDAEFKGNLKVVNTLEVPRVMGTVDLVQGKMKFKDRDFTIQSATGEFDSPTVLNPKFSLTAQTEVNSVKIQLYASGRLRGWKAEVTSNPSLPEQEILSLLALGGTQDTRTRLGANDRSSVEQGEAASLLLNSLDFNREIEAKTGFQIQLDESVNSQIGISAFRPTTGESVTAPKIVIRRRVGDRLELSYGSTLGIGTNTQKEGAAEIKVNRGFSIQGVYDAIDTVGVEQTQKSYGLDLKWQKRFK